MPSLQVQSYLPVASVTLVAGQEYFAFSLLVSHQKTVGATSCAGCSAPACLTLQYIEVEDASGTVTTVSTDNTTSFDYFATWQGGFVVNGVQACNGLTTSTRRSTWGAVKALYR